MRSCAGKTPEDLAVEMGRVEICQLVRSVGIQGTFSRVSSVASLVSLGESLSRASLDDYFAGSEWDESTYGQEDQEQDQEQDDIREDFLYAGTYIHISLGCELTS